MKQLTTRDAKFVAAFLEGNTAGDSARIAGFKCTNQKSFNAVGKRALRRPIVKAAIDASHQEIAKAGEVTAVSMLQEASDAADFAKAKGNPMAYVKAVELRAKLSGLLIDRVDQRSVGNLTVEIVRLTEE